MVELTCVPILVLQLVNLRSGTKAKGSSNDKIIWSEEKEGLQNKLWHQLVWQQNMCRHKQQEIYNNVMQTIFSCRTKWYICSLILPVLFPYSILFELSWNKKSSYACQWPLCSWVKNMWEISMILVWQFKQNNDFNPSIFPSDKIKEKSMEMISYGCNYYELPSPGRSTNDRNNQTRNYG